ncbi:hypothetical protein Syun_023818 [Stephania yunnanensis]|uniref:Uncharacterized protein n=1 Tax=Stephania yunnanensis TaxID=152371 RepID=A0AAP0FJS0_9MAGN
MCSGGAGAQVTKSSGCREDAGRARMERRRGARWTRKGGEGQASFQDVDAVVGATPGSDARDQQDATSADSSNSSGPPTQTTSGSGELDL